jgi:hypothetical protein
MGKWLRLLRWLPWCARLGETRDERLLRACGCICFCPGCNEPLNDQADTYRASDVCYGYVCSLCGWVSRFYFGAPAPLLVESGMDVNTDGWIRLDEVQP